MELREWDERYRTGERREEDWNAKPNPLLVETAQKLSPGKALDVACGSGRNSIWLAEHGWNVTAVDGAAAAVNRLRDRAAELGVGIAIETKIVDLERSSFEFGDSWDFIAICFYLQRTLFEPAKRALRPNGVILAIVHITAGGEEPTAHRLRPGELREYFSDYEILHYHEGEPNDAAHKRRVAEIVARKRMTPEISNHRA